MNCRICNGTTHKVFDLRSQRHAIDVPVFRCRTCDAYFSNGGPVNYDNVDLSSYYLRFADAIRARYERIFRHLETLVRPGRILDIGAGMGFSLEVASRRHWSPKGVEPNKALADHARLRGLDVVNDYLTDKMTGEFDALVVDNVLEHVPEPLALLRTASKLLTPRGVMLVTVPPLDWLREALASSAVVRDRVKHPQLNVFGEVDEHINMLGRRAMGRLVQAVGLEILDVRFHHSRLFSNAIFRALGLDDGYYFIKHR